MSQAQEDATAGAERIESAEEIVRKAEEDVRSFSTKELIRNRLVVVIRAERQLKKILQLDPNTPLRDWVEENLSKAQEILGQHYLLIARFYLSRYNDGSGRVKGAESRLLHIVREYPRFSQTDEVLLLLGKIYKRTEQLEDATNYFWKLICQHPTSEHVSEAYEQLGEIGFDAAKGCDNLKP
ncbi:MAG TPA: hypothetical protein VF766_13985 [Pyrinomonadaceae bacterium]